VGRAVEILEVMKSLFQHDAQDAVFPGNKTVLSDATLAKVLRVNGGTGFTVHGFRSSFRDWAADSGFPDGWAEAALAHGNPDKTEAAYRRTTYFSQRRDALMPAWENFLFAAPATTRTRPTHD
jgi:integrase